MNSGARNVEHIRVEMDGGRMFVDGEGEGMGIMAIQRDVAQR